MPFKSEAQRRKFAEMVREGKITQETYDAWHSDTPKGKLPDRVAKPDKSMRAFKAKEAKVIK